MFGFGFQYGKVLGLSIGALLASVFRKRVIADGGIMEGEGCVTSELNRLNKIGILDDVSLAMIPSGYKESKLYSVVPASGDGDLTFTRSTTGTRVNADGLIESVAINTPRIDYTGGGCGSLLLEPQRTNLITYSEDFSNADWAKRNLTVTNSASSPDGETNAYKFVPNAAVGNRYLNNSASLNTSENTNSFFLKKGELDFVKIGNAAAVVTVNLNTGALSKSTDSINDYSIKEYANGWWRVYIYNKSAVSYQIQLFVGVDSNGSNIATNGTDGIYVFGAQLDSGSYATSYIPTAGSTVTRTADSSSTSGLSSVINSEEGVLYLKSQALFNDLTNRTISISDGTANNSVILRYSSTTQTISADVIVAGVSQCLMSYAVADVKAIHGIAIRYKVNDFSLWVDGVERATDASGSTFSASTLDTFAYDNGAGGDSFYGRVSEDVIADYLTDLEMAELTTL